MEKSLEQLKQEYEKTTAVSYTHLDVYKRQAHTAGSLPENIFHKPCTAGSKAPSHLVCSDNR